MNIYKIKEFVQKRNLLPAISLSIAMGILLFIYAPLEVYFNNKSDIWYDFVKITPICLLMFSISTFLSIIVFLFTNYINRLLYHIAVICCTIVFICLYVQGNFMVQYLPAFNGADIDWSELSIHRLYSILLWIIVISLTLILIKFIHIDKMLKAISYIGAFFSAMLLLSLIIMGVSTGGFEKKWNMVVTDDFQFDMSTDRNYIILMLDAIDGDELTELIQKHPEYKTAFKDFTYYDDVMSAYPFTELSVPFLFSGEYFVNQEPYETYNLNAFTDSPLLDRLESSGYRLGLYEPDAPLYSNKMYRFENIIDNRQSINSVFNMIKIQIKLMGLKYLPFDLKKHCIIQPGDIDRLRKYENGKTCIEFWDSNQTFYSQLNSSPIVLSDEKCFRYIHIEGAHLPYRYDAEMNVISSDLATYTSNVEASMTIAMKYLQLLKDNGVYDNSAIIIMSDHGYNRFEYDAQDGRQHAVLLTKGFNESGNELQFNHAPIAHEDFQNMAIRLLDGANGSELTDYHEGDYRERRYLYFYTYDNIYEYMQTGRAADMETLVPTGNEYHKQ